MLCHVFFAITFHQSVDEVVTRLVVRQAGTQVMQGKSDVGEQACQGTSSSGLLTDFNGIALGFERILPTPSPIKTIFEKFFLQAIM